MIPKGSYLMAATAETEKIFQQSAPDARTLQVVSRINAFPPGSGASDAIVTVGVLGALILVFLYLFRRI